MIAIEITKPGGPEVLQAQERPIPKPANRELLIRVEAAGLARADLLQRQGKYPPPPGASLIPGLDVAGLVESVGSDVTEFAAGQRVCAILAGGGYAEYCVAPAGQVLPTPENWTSIEAVTLPENLFTAYDNLVIRGGLQAGKRVLVHGGTSGVGSMAILLAKTLGATPFATAGSDEKVGLARGIGAEQAVNYRTGDFQQAVAEWTDGGGVDMILDMVGAPYLERNLASLAPEGTLVIIATQGGATGVIDLRTVMAKRIRVTGSMMRARSPREKQIVRDRLLSETWPALPGKRGIRPLVDRVFPLRDASKAHAYLEGGGRLGKVVLSA